MIGVGENRHEKIFKLDDGSRMKILVTAWADFRGVEYNYSVYTSAYKKRSWNDAVDRSLTSFREMSVTERTKEVLKQQIKVAGRDRMMEVALELWNNLKPKAP